MKRKLRGFKRSAIELDFNLYRVNTPIAGLTNANLSVIDIWPEGVDKTIMFVHGYGGCAETWEHQINNFARDYRVIAPDLRGHGQSDAPLTQYTMPELVEDLKTIADSLDLPDKFVLAGHSFGGSITVEFANAYPERLERLILVATAGEYPVPKLAHWIARAPVALLRPWWPYRPRWNAEPHVMKRMMLNNLSKWQGWSLLRNVRTPTLIITGQRDNYFPRYVFDDLSKMVPEAEIYDVGSAKHKVQLERHQAVNRAIRRFIDGNGHRASWREASSSPPKMLRNRPWLSSYSHNTPPTVPIPRQPVYKFLESAANWVPKRTATIFFGHRLTYQQLDEQANQFAQVLHGLGLKPGDRVMLVLPNIPQMIVAYFGILKIGGVIVLSNPEAGEALIVRQIEETQAKILITLRDFNHLLAAARAQKSIKAILIADIRGIISQAMHAKLRSHWNLAPAPDSSPLDAQSLLIDEVIQDADTVAPPVRVSSEALAVIIYTSGTVNEPKGVCLTHANLVANATQTRHWVYDLAFGKEIFLTVAPLTHSYGMTNGMNIPIAIGATVLLLPAFDVEQILKTVKTYRPTVFPGVPSMFMALNRAPNVRNYGLESIKACVSGSAPLPVEVQEAFEKLTRGRLVEGYGLTEASPGTHANPLYGLRKVGSIGVPLPNTDAKIIDPDTGQDLAAGEIGELVVKGPQVMQGYWGDLKRTAIVLQNGWLKTGDIAVMDDDGYFRIISRKQDTITIDQHEVYPRDVEEVIYEHSKVHEVAVFGVNGKNGQQKIKAFVVLQPGATLPEEALLDFCRRRLDDYAVPNLVEFRDKLPKTFMGKVSRSDLLSSQ